MNGLIFKAQFIPFLFIVILVNGIENINVVVKEKTAHINYDKSKVDLMKIENTITEAGYDANDKKADPKAYENLDDCCKLPKDRK